MEIKSVLCARSKHSYIVHLNHCEQPYTQCAHPNRFEILYYMPLKLKPNLPNGQIPHFSRNFNMKLLCLYITSLIW